MPPFIKLSIICVISTLILSCNDGNKMTEKATTFPSIKDVPASAWERLSQKKIYFGHQSVGYNIIDGIKDVMKENPQIKLNIVETSNPADFNSAIFAHSKVGKNTDPKSKTDSFGEYIKAGIGEKADIAFFKFCFVDIDRGTDIKGLLEDYQTKMAKFEKEYPNTKFIHMTVPLKTTKINWKTWIKELIGKGDMYEYAGNIERNDYNDLLKKAYGGKESLFDLAKIESTYQDGKRSSFTSNGKTYYCLAPEYTTDGGHLNEKGCKIVAEQLLIFFADLAK
jgi:hypothetical protein